MLLEVHLCNAWPEAVDTSRETYVKNKNKNNNNKTPKNSFPTGTIEGTKKKIRFLLCQTLLSKSEGISQSEDQVSEKFARKMLHKSRRNLIYEKGNHHQGLQADVQNWYSNV